MQLIGFSFLNVGVTVQSDSSALVSRLKRDFSHFLAPTVAEPKIQLTAFHKRSPEGSIPKCRIRIKTKNSIAFQSGGLRYNQYDRDTWSIYDFKKDEAVIYSPHMDRLHEVTYLVILSRVGKILDSKGLHRIHAMGIARKGVSAVLLMPMKGGKTTLFLNSLKEPDTEILSDDSPLVTKRGTVSALPVRIGLLPDSMGLFREMSHVDFSQVYELSRMRHGKKFLLPISSVSNRVSTVEHQRILLLKGKRRKDAEAGWREVSRLGMVPALLSNMVIGVGLPIMAEYFIENRIGDLPRLMKILGSRMFASFQLLKNSVHYRFYLGTDHEKNARVLGELLDLHAGEAG